MSELSKLDEPPKPLSLEDKISNEDLELYFQGERFVLHEEKYLSFAAAKFKGNQIKVFKFQVDNSQIVSHQLIATLEGSLNKYYVFL